MTDYSSYVVRRQSSIVGVCADSPLLSLGSRCDSPELYPPLISPSSNIQTAHTSDVLTAILVLALRSPPTRGGFIVLPPLVDVFSSPPALTYPGIFQIHLCMAVGDSRSGRASSINYAGLIHSSGFQ